MPARVASITAGALRLPAATQAPIAALVTPLQLHTCISAGISSSVIFWPGRAEVEQQRQPLVRQPRVAIEALHQVGALLMSPMQDAADEPAVAHDQLLVGALLGLGELHDLVALVSGLGDPHRGELDAHDLELGRELRAVIGGIGVAARDVVGENLGLLP